MRYWNLKSYTLQPEMSLNVIRVLCFPSWPKCSRKRALTWSWNSKKNIHLEDLILAGETGQALQICSYVDWINLEIYGTVRPQLIAWSCMLNPASKSREFSINTTNNTGTMWGGDYSNLFDCSQFTSYTFIKTSVYLRYIQLNIKKRNKNNKN